MKSYLKIKIFKRIFEFELMQTYSYLITKTNERLDETKRMSNKLVCIFNVIDPILNHLVKLWGKTLFLAEGFCVVISF